MNMPVIGSCVIEIRPKLMEISGKQRTSGGVRFPLTRGRRMPRIMRGGPRIRIPEVMRDASVMATERLVSNEKSDRGADLYDLFSTPTETSIERTTW